MDVNQEKPKYGRIPVERRKQIVAYVSKNESAQIKELADLFDDVSEATIRRDLELLASEGKLRRTHGGAESILTHTSFEQLYRDKCAMNVEEKRRIAKAAAEMVENGDSIILDSGTTTIEIARHLVSHTKLTIITNDLHIASSVVFHPSTQVIVAGGMKRDDVNVLVGNITETFFRSIRVDKTFLAADAVDLDFGISNTTFVEQNIKRLMMEAAKKIILVADHSKFGNTALAQVCPLHEVDHIMTDSGLPVSIREEMERRGLPATVV